MSYLRLLSVSFCLTWIALGGCAKQPMTHSDIPHAEANDPATPEPYEGTPQPNAQTQTVQPAQFDKTAVTPLEDRQIAKITDTLNAGEIEQAEVAERRSSNPTVRQLAEAMHRDHEKLQRDGATFAKEAAIAPMDSKVESDLRDNGKITLDALTKASGGDFDMQYVEAQITEHEAALHLLDEKLLPNAKNPALKTQLEGARAVISEHLLHAKNVREDLKGAR